MAQLIQKTGFISRKSAGGYMKYIATREGVEVLTGKGPVTEKQKGMVTKLLKDFPDMRDSFEYEDYKQAPTLHTASALISAALDSHMQNLQSENGYLRYIATRPGVEKHGAHGLFGRQENTNLAAAMHDLTAHDGNVWTIIYSLHREDAERLGYNNAAAWRKLLVSQQNKFAEAFHVPASALHWYAAYHDVDTHPHIHMMIWTDQETVLKRDAVVKLRSAMTNSIFQAELENLYIRKDAAYKDVTEAARSVVKSSMAISKSRSRIWWIPSWMSWKSCRRWRRIMPSGMVYAIRWRAITKTGPVSTIRSPTRKNSARSRTPSFRKRNACGSR